MSHAGLALIDPHKIFSTINLGSGMRVADMGCGRTGHFVFLASRVVGDKGIVYAIDIIKDILENIKSRVRSEGYDNVQTIWSDIELPGKTPIPEGSLDVCFYVNVMFLLKHRIEALEEARRLLKTGGFLNIVDWAKKLGPLGPDPTQMAEPISMTKIAEDLGFELVDKTPAGEYHYSLIFKKS